MKVVLGILISLLFITNVEASEKIEVSLSKCVDGDTAWFILKDEEIKTRFLAIDTPESTNKIEAFGQEASDFTCNILKNATKIEIEYDDKSDKLDKYNRHLVWVFVDGELLQDLIIKKGLGQIEYIYGDYKYLSQLEASEMIAKNSQIGIWQDTNYHIYYIIGIIIIIIIIIICIFNKKIRDKIFNKFKNKAKKEIKKKIRSLK